MSMDKMIWQGKEYELAKNTLSLARKIEAAEQAVSMTDAYRREMEVIIEALGHDAVYEILESTDIEDVDLTTLVLVYNSVIDGYEKRILDMRTRNDEKLFNSPSIKGIKQVADDVRVIQQIDSKRI